MKVTLGNLCIELCPKMRLCVLDHFDPEAKKQSMLWKHPGSPPPEKFRSFFSREVMVSVFSDSQVIIFVDFLEEGHTINDAYYAKELMPLGQNICEEKKGKVARYAPPHTCQVAVATDTKCSFKVLPDPLYYPDLAHSGFYLFQI